MPDFDEAGFSGRLVEAMDAMRVSQTKLARLLGVTPQAVQQWVAGKTVPRERFVEIGRALGSVDPGWLQYGVSTGFGLYPPRGTRAPAAVEEGPNVVDFDRLEEPAPTRPVPLISWVSAGAWSEAADPYAPGEASSWVEASAQVGKHAFALTVRGDSMSPEFPEGCTIIVDPSVKASPGRYVVARKDAWDEATFKRYVVEAGIPYLKPINPAYLTVPVEPGTRIIGVVVEMSLSRRY